MLYPQPYAPLVVVDCGLIVERGLEFAVDAEQIGRRLDLAAHGGTRAHAAPPGVHGQTLSYLDNLIQRGEARNLAEALDLAIERLRVHENRERLAADTADYFANMTNEEAAEEKRLEAALSQTSAGIDFDQ